MVKKAGKPCLIVDTAISGPLATRGRLLRHLGPDFRRDTGATHHFMPLQPMGGGGRTTHRINVITAKSLGEKVTREMDENARPSTRPRGWEVYLHKAETYD